MNRICLRSALCVAKRLAVITERLSFTDWYCYNTETYQVDLWHITANIRAQLCVLRTTRQFTSFWETSPEHDVAWWPSTRCQGLEQGAKYADRFAEVASPRPKFRAQDRLRPRQTLQNSKQPELLPQAGSRSAPAFKIRPAQVMPSL